MVALKVLTKLNFPFEWKISQRSCHYYFQQTKSINLPSSFSRTVTDILIFLDIYRHWSLHKVDTLSPCNRQYLALDSPLPQLVIYNVKNGSIANPSAFFHFKCSIQSLYCKVKASGSYGETTLDYHLNRYNYYYQQLEVTLIPILPQFYLWQKWIIFWSLFSFSWALFTIVTIISCMI